MVHCMGHTVRLDPSYIMDIMFRRRNWIIFAVTKLLLSFELAELCGNASEPSVLVDRFRVVSTETSGSCFLIIAVESLTCNVTCRRGQIAANSRTATSCTDRPAPLTFDV